MVRFYQLSKYEKDGGYDKMVPVGWTPSTLAVKGCSFPGIEMEDLRLRNFFSVVEFNYYYVPIF